MATHLQIYMKGGIIDSKGMGTVQKGTPHKCSMAKLEESTASPSMQGHCRKQTRARFLPRELMYELSVLSTVRVEIAS